jgi:nucleoside-diphosphate-sugar epimerase
MAGRMTKSIVFGASGIVGRYIVERLVADGQRPLAVSRKQRQAVDVDWIVADLAMPTLLDLTDVSTLYCTAHVGLLADALPHFVLPHLKRVVAFTSTSIVTKRNSEIAEEREHVRHWEETEQQAVEVCERLGVVWTVLRPTMIYAEGRDANITRLARLIQKISVMPLAGRGTGLRQPVHAEDLAIGAIAAARSPAAENKIYAVPGTEILSYREMIGRIFDGLHKRRCIVSVPPLLWRAAFALAGPFVPNANVAMGMRMSQDMIFDPKPAIADFDWSPRPFRPEFR